MKACIILPYNHDESDLARAVSARFGEGAHYRILKRSIDARQHRNIKVEYSVTTEPADPAEEARRALTLQKRRLNAHFGQSARPVPVVVGTGPGGLFCALWLQLNGFCPIVLEQGPPLNERLRDMARFMKNGDLNPYSNICFGAGGAGTYSDGKLITRIRSPFIPFVTAAFVESGAPEEIRFLYNPHLGSNLIRRCIANILAGIERGGASIRYRTRLADFDQDANGGIAGLFTVRTDAGAPCEREPAFRMNETDALFLAAGHSSQETYAMLRARSAAMECKDFAVGVRVEHTADAIDEMQYGKQCRTRYPGIETAQYRLARTWQDEKRAVYSFCMCPGGYVLNSSTNADGVVTNGMSNSRKSGRFSNAAIVVNVSGEDLAGLGFAGVDAAMEFRKELEERCRSAVNSAGRSNVVPGQLLADFLQGSRTRSLKQTACLNPAAPASLHSLLPDFVTTALQRGFAAFERKMRGFSSDASAQVFGPESRTSSPYRIRRDKASLASESHPNLYPIGEGAGYAGGITSAAVDGIRCAQAWIGRFIQPESFGAASDSANIPQDDESPL